MRLVPKKTGLRSLAISSTMLPLVVVVFRFFLGFDFYYENSILYQLLCSLSSLAAMGAGVIALVMALFPATIRSTTMVRAMPFVASSLLSMGITTATLSSLSTYDDRYAAVQLAWQLLGALPLVVLWLPFKPFSSRRSSNRVGWMLPVVWTSITLITAVGLLHSRSLPNLANGYFWTPTFLASYSLCGLAFLISAAHFAKAYQREGRSSELVLAHFCVLSGITDLVWPGLHLWGPIWWSSSVFQLVAFISVLVYFVVLHASLERTLEDSEMRFRTLANASNEALLVLEEGSPHDWNSGFERLFGSPSSREATGLLALPVFASPKVQPDAVETVLNTKIGNRTLLVSQRHVGRTVLVVLRDISDQKAAEDRLKGLNRQLVRSNTELKQYSGIISADLQQPLQNIGTYLNLLERRSGGQLETDARQYLNYSQEATRKLKVLVSDLLSYAQLGTQPYEPELTAFDEILKQVLAKLEPLIADTKTTVQVRGSLPTLETDPSWIETLMTNLILNAIQFRGREAPRIVIECRQTASEWHFRFQDNGRGIEEEAQEKVFAPCWKLGSEGPGTGLGLSSCRRIVERLGGCIWVISKLGEGSNFHFTLPAKPPSVSYIPFKGREPAESAAPART